MVYSDNNTHKINKMMYIIGEILYYLINIGKAVLDVYKLNTN